jgi:DNA repair protein SbcC/Rad50
LAAWAAARAPVLSAAAAAADARAAAASAEHIALADSLTTHAHALGVTADPPAGGIGGLRAACVEGLAAVRALRARLVADIERAQVLRAVVAEQTEAGLVAQTLARHLAANGFERWLLDEALTRLAAGASRRLRELSAGQYSLAVDEQRNFSVVDHHSADERRPARTLSGGETFLAALALALTLADHLVELSADGTPRLEAIFLDEGFGTLDGETLDVVAGAREELGARGRTVGLVTHVRELAERLPVRFEVRKAPGGSQVERVVA